MKIELYTRDSCEFCAKAKDLLKLEQVSYYEYNINRGQATREDVFDRIGLPYDAKVTLPVVLIDDEYIGGFDKLAEYFAAMLIERQYLIDVLSKGIVNLEFTKADGSLRKMNATLDTKYIDGARVLQEVVLEKNALTEFQAYQKNQRVLSVFDTDVGAWRSFRIDRLKAWKPVELA